MAERIIIIATGFLLDLLFAIRTGYIILSVRSDSSSHGRKGSCKSCSGTGRNRRQTEERNARQAYFWYASFCSFPSVFRQWYWLWQESSIPFLEQVSPVSGVISC